MVAKVKLYESRAWLARKYQWEKLTAAEIAKECGVSEATISRWLVKHDLMFKTRSKK